MTKTLNHIIFFFLQQNQNIFFSNIGNQNIFLEKNHNPPLQVKWSVPYGPLSIVKLYIMDKSSVPFDINRSRFNCTFGNTRGCCGRDRMVVGFTATCAISAYHHSSCEFEPHSWQGVLDTTLCNKVCQWLATGQCFSPVSTTNKTDLHDITEILLKVALNIINGPTKPTTLETTKN